MNRIIIKPARRIFSRRQQWTFSIVAANGEPIDPRDTLYNRDEQISILTDLFVTAPLELVLLDRFGNIEERRPLR